MTGARPNSQDLIQPSEDPLVGSQPAVSVADLAKTYELDDGVIRAVDDISFEIESGSVVGLLGPNGAGKTTTIKAILGLLVPTAGEITINGVDVQNYPRQAYQHVSAVLEGARNIYWRLTVRENLQFFAGLQGVPQTDATPQFEAHIDALDLTAKLDEPVQALSRGMKQKVALTCALARQTPIVFLDEPTLGLDLKTSHNLRSSLRDLTGQDRTIVLSSHDMDVVQDVCDRVIIMNQGQIIADDTVTNLIDLFQTQAYRVTLSQGYSPTFWNQFQREFTVTEQSTNADQVEIEVTLRDTDRFYEFVDFLRDENVGLASISSVEPDLEEVFLSLTERGPTAPTAGTQEVNSE